MSIITLPNGFGDSTGTTLGTAEPIQVSANVWYVDSSDGVDAASPAGQNRVEPLATLGQAITNCADGDVIVLKDGHAETITSTLTIDHDVVILGMGRSSSLPTVKFTNNQANAAMWNVTASHLTIENIWFEENAQSSTANRITTDAITMFRMLNCYVECGQYDAEAFYAARATINEIRDTTFISTAASLTAQPDSALKSYATTPTIIASGLVFDGGTYGFSNYAALDFSDGHPAYIYIQCSLLNGADAKIPQDTTEGYINVQTSTGGARVDWCDVAGPPV